MDFRRPCLPVPSQNKRKNSNAKRNRRRREQRKRQKQQERQGDDGDAAAARNDPKVEKHENDNDDDATSKTDETEASAMMIRFDDISSMSATDYLSRVVCQANRLPEIFCSSPPPPTEQHQQEQQQEKHEPKNKKATTRSTTASSTTSKSFPGSVSASLACFTSNHRHSNNGSQHEDATGIRTSSLVGHLPLPPPSVDHFLPTLTDDGGGKEWIAETLESFQQLRWYLDQVREAAKTNNNHYATKNTTRQPVPALKDRPAWHVFCLGQAEAEGNVGSYFGDDSDDNDDDDDDEKQETGSNEKKSGEDKDSPNDRAEEGDPSFWRQGLPETGFSPTVSLLLQMDQVMVRAVLRHLAHVDTSSHDSHDEYEEEFPPLPLSSSSSKPSAAIASSSSSTWRRQSSFLLLTPSRTSWIYALLACLEKPLHRQEAAFLYQLLKRLCLLRASMQPTKATTTTATSSSSQQEQEQQQQAELGRCNVLITIIAMYFEQGGESVMKVASC